MGGPLFVWSLSARFGAFAFVELLSSLSGRGVVRFSFLFVVSSSCCFGFLPSLCFFLHPLGLIVPLLTFHALYVGLPRVFRRRPRVPGVPVVVTAFFVVCSVAELVWSFPGSVDFVLCLPTRTAIVLLLVAPFALVLICRLPMRFPLPFFPQFVLRMLFNASASASCLAPSCMWACLGLPERVVLLAAVFVPTVAPL